MDSAFESCLFHCIFQIDNIFSFSLQFFVVPTFRNATLKCLTEIAGIQSELYDIMLVDMFTQTGQQLEHVSSFITDLLCL